MKLYSLFFLLISLFLLINCKNQTRSTQKNNLVFKDSGTENWQDKWTLDGLKAEVLNSDLGMEFKAGKQHGNDSAHAVLWTKKVFTGNFKITYEYTRTDTVTRCVNILYLLASGKGSEEYPKDISLWKEKRKVPKMSKYFNNINTYHISYAAFDSKIYSGDHDYIRMRKYNPNKKGLGNTDIKPDYFNTGLFKPFVNYKIEVIKTDGFIKMDIENAKNPKERLICKWDISKVNDLKSGRIGLRHMYTRSAIYKNFEIYQLD